MVSFNFDLKITNIFKSSGWGLEKSELPWEHNFFIAIHVGVFPVKLLVYMYQVSTVCAANWQDSSIYILDVILD